MTEAAARIQQESADTIKVIQEEEVQEVTRIFEKTILLSVSEYQRSNRRDAKVSEPKVNHNVCKQLYPTKIYKSIIFVRKYMCCDE